MNLYNHATHTQPMEIDSWDADDAKEQMAFERAANTKAEIKATKTFPDTKKKK